MNQWKNLKFSVTRLMVIFLFFPVSADLNADDKIAKLITEGKVDLKLRYRYANVDQDGLLNNANASTLQTMLGFKSGEVSGFSGYLQFRNVSNIGSESYNNTLNGKTSFPVVIDPSSTEVDQAYIKYSAIKNISVTAGRRKLSWGNQRFISALGWRQNNRSFDSAVLEGWSGDKAFQAKYAYAWNVNRAFTDRSPIGNFDSNIHLFNLAYSGFEYGRLETYAYLLDLKDAFAFGLATKTFGVNFGGKAEISKELKLLYFAEYARQSDYAGNVNEYTVDYFRFEGGVGLKNGLTLSMGYEKMGGDGRASFKTPLALLHAFNGWADKFIVTPANGLIDKYAKAVMKFENASGFLKGTSITFFYHDFDSDTGGLNYGTEFDAAVAYKFARHYSVMLKAAFYNADQFDVDTTKLWFVVSANF